jgi:hypothetical protein
MKKNMKESIKKIRIKYPDKIPVFIYKSKKDKILDDINNNKFLVPDTITIGQFLIIIRKRIKLEKEQSLFLFVNNTIPCTSESIINIYDKFKNKDDMLIMEYCGENVFG